MVSEAYNASIANGGVTLTLERAPPYDTMMGSLPVAQFAIDWYRKCRLYVRIPARLSNGGTRLMSTSDMLLNTMVEPFINAR